MPSKISENRCHECSALWVCIDGDPAFIKNEYTPSAEKIAADFEAWLDEPVVKGSSLTRRKAMFARVALPSETWELMFGFAAEAWAAAAGRTG